jgi:hypothetical protein
MSWLHRERADETFDRACRVGFLVAGDLSTPVFDRFEAWCRQHDRPLVWIRPRGRWADISLRMETCGGHLTEERVAEWGLVLDLMTPHDTVSASGTGYLINGVPLGQAEMVAFRLFEWALDSRQGEVPASGWSGAW